MSRFGWKHRLRWAGAAALALTGMAGQAAGITRVQCVVGTLQALLHQGQFTNKNLTRIVLNEAIADGDTVDFKTKKDLKKTIHVRPLEIRQEGLFLQHDALVTQKPGLLWDGSKKTYALDEIRLSPQELEDRRRQAVRIYARHFIQPRPPEASKAFPKAKPAVPSLTLPKTMGLAEPEASSRGPSALSAGAAQAFSAFLPAQPPSTQPPTAPVSDLVRIPMSGPGSQSPIRSRSAVVPLQLRIAKSPSGVLSREKIDLLLWQQLQTFQSRDVEILYQTSDEVRHRVRGRLVRVSPASDFIPSVDVQSPNGVQTIPIARILPEPVNPFAY